MTVSPSPRHLARWAMAGLGLLVAVGFIVVILRSVDLAAVAAAAGSAHIGLLLLGLLPFVAGYAIRIVRWRLLLRPVNPALGWRDCAVPLLGGFALNNVLPARAGDVVRIVAFQGRLGAGAAAITGSVMVERILDLLALVACLMLGLALVPHDHLPAGMVRIGGWLGGGILAGGALVLIGAGWIRPRCERFAASGAGLPRRLAGLVARVLVGMDLVRDPRRLALVVLCSVLVWAGEWGLYVCVERSLATGAGWAGSVLAMAAGNLATLIPGTPGHVGTFHYFAAEAMTAAGAGREAAVACAIMVHLLFWGTTTVVGLVVLAATGWWRPKPVASAPPASSPSSVPRP